MALIMRFYKGQNLFLRVGNDDCRRCRKAIQGGVRDPKIAPRKSLRVLFFESATVVGNILVNNRAYPGIAHDYRRTFKRLKQVHLDIFLANHSSSTDMEAKRAEPDGRKVGAFVDRASFALYVEDLHRTFEQQLAKEQKLSESKLPLTNSDQAH